MTTQTDEMPLWQVITLIIVFVVTVDVIAFIYAVNSGWRYPFMLCAIVNICVVLATHVIGIMWMIVHRR